MGVLGVTTLGTSTPPPDLIIKRDGVGESWYVNRSVFGQIRGLPPFSINLFLDSLSLPSPMVVSKRQ